MTPPRQRRAIGVVLVLVGVASCWPRSQHAWQPRLEQLDLALVQGLPGVGAKTAPVALQALQRGHLAALPRSAQEPARDWFDWSGRSLVDPEAAVLLPGASQSPTTLQSPGAGSARPMRSHEYDDRAEHRLDRVDRSPAGARGNQP